MPEGGRYKELPRPESFRFFEERVSSYPFCISVDKCDTQIYEIIRQGKSKLTVFLTNIYIVGEADIYEIVKLHPEVDTIVTISLWNSYSLEAKELAKSFGVALFKMNEFQGTIYYNGQKYIDYIPPERDEEYFTRRRNR